jgi:hypothetical protein
MGAVFVRERFRVGPSPFGPGTDAYEVQSSYGAPFFSGGVERDVTPWIRLRAEARLALVAEASIVSGLFGVQVPIGGRYAAGEDDPGAPPALRALHPGQRVWLTRRDGTEISGDWAGAGADAMSVRTRSGLTRIALSEISRAETTDRLREGMIYGSTIGAATGAGLGAFVAMLCEDDDGCEEAAVLGVIAIGTATGFLVGTTADSLRERRRTIYEAGSGGRERRWLVVPAVSRRSGAVRAVFSW